MCFSKSSSVTGSFNVVVVVLVVVVVVVVVVDVVVVVVIVVVCLVVVVVVVVVSIVVVVSSVSHILLAFLSRQQSVPTRIYGLLHTGFWFEMQQADRATSVTAIAKKRVLTIVTTVINYRPESIKRMYYL